MIVRLHRDAELLPDLTPGQSYAVLGIEADDYRLLNDAGNRTSIPQMPSN